MNKKNLTDALTLSGITMQKLDGILNKLEIVGKSEEEKELRHNLKHIEEIQKKINKTLEWLSK